MSPVQNLAPNPPTPLVPTPRPSGRPSDDGRHTPVRRRRLRTLLARDTASFARHWWGKLWSPPSWSGYRSPWWSRR